MNNYKIIYLSIGCIFFINAICYSETFWEKRRRAYKKLKTDEHSSESSSVRRSRTLRSTPPTAKEKFGVKEVKKHSSTRQFRNPYNITIPVSFGEVLKIRYNKDKPLIINIQDYHCNYQAQKQIAYLLEDLIVNIGLTLIMVEGNSKDATLKHLRSMATRERRIEVAEDYLKRGMISGEEYLDIISEYDFKPLGIEDKELYMQNLDAFLEIDAFQKKALVITEAFQMVIKNLKPRIYNRKLLEIDTKRNSLEDEKLKFDEYTIYLFNMARKHNVSLNFTQTHIKNALKVAELSKKIDFKKISHQRDMFVNNISKKLNDEELTRLLFKSKEYKNDRINSNDFHSYLQTLPHGNWEKNYPDLVEYVYYLAMHSSIDPVKLFEELDVIEQAVKEKLIKNNNERYLMQYARNIEILHGFFALELIPSKYKYFKEHPEEFKIPEWQAFLDRMVRKYKLTKTVPQDISLLVNKMDRVDNFYRLAIERDHVFVKKIKGYMKQENADIGVLITGGFHSTQLSTLIYDAGYSFMTVLPNVSQETDSELYRSVLKYKANLMKQAEQNK